MESYNFASSELLSHCRNETQLPCFKLLWTLSHLSKAWKQAMVGVHCKSLFKSSPTFSTQSPTIKQIARIFTQYLNRAGLENSQQAYRAPLYWMPEIDFRHIILENICKDQLRAWQTYTNPGRKTSEVQRVVQNYWTPTHPVTQITARLPFKKEGPTWKPPASCLRKHSG